MEKSSEIINELLSRFKTQPRWIQHLAVNFGNDDSLDETTIQHIKILCINESNGTDIEGPSDIELIRAFGIQQEFSTSLRINQLRNPIGINNLNPTTKLEFGDYPLTVIFGLNGAGKSGFVRILKNISDHFDKNTILPNVFLPPPETQKCDISYQVNNESIREVEWSIDKQINNELKSIDIYDGTSGNEYLKGIKSVTYESPFLRVFDNIIDGIGLIKTGIESDLNRLKQQIIIPPRPDELSSTSSFRWLNSINKDTPLSEVEYRCEWDETNEKELKDLRKRFDQKSPAEEAKNIRKKISYLNEILDNSKKYCMMLSDENCLEIVGLRKQSEATKKLAKQDAERIFKGKLDGIGSIEWRQMWESAKKYSEEYAYKDEEFPNTKNGTRCVLCQQELGKEGKENLLDFKDYILNQLNQKAEELSGEIERKEGMIPIIADEIVFRTKLEAGGINDEKIIISVLECFENFRERSVQLLEKETSDLIENKPRFKWRGPIKRNIKKLILDATNYEMDSQAENKDEIKEQISELVARKWICDNKESIELYIEHLIQIYKLELASSKANRIGCSKIKMAISEQYLSQDYVDRFNRELNLLGADRIEVKAKTHIRDSSLSLEIALENTFHNNLNEVLSEGEKRIIAIAAFLTDVRSKEQSTPFIFDDPITSLDDDYESNVAERLATLSNERQVLVFTHRISLLTKLNLIQGDKAKYIGIWSTGGKAGIEGGLPLNAKSASTILNTILHEKLIQSRKFMDDGDMSGYETYERGIVSEIRIAIESLIEDILLNKVVKRFRHKITTEGRLRQLAIIEESDCNILNKVMGKYSNDLHPSPEETPKKIYSPEEIEIDVRELLDWLSRFKKRKKQFDMIN